MARTQVVATLTISLLALSFWVGSGAEDYVAWDSGETNVDTEFEQQQIDLSEASTYEYTYYDSDDQRLKANRTEFENETSYISGDTPRAEFEPGIEDIDSYSIEVDYPNGTPSSRQDRITFSQGIFNPQRLSNGTTVVDNTEEEGDFAIEYPVDDSEDPIWNASIVRISTSNEEATRQGFIDNLQGLASVSSGYPFVQEVIIGAILVVISYLIVRLFPTVG